MVYINDHLPDFPPVKPDATPEEVKAVVNDDQGGQIFTQAVSLRCQSFQLSHRLVIASILQFLWRVTRRVS